MIRELSINELLPLCNIELYRPFPSQANLSLVPRGRLELPRTYVHHPLKMACLPIPPPRRGRGGRIRTHDLRFWRPLLYQSELRPYKYHVIISEYTWGDSSRPFCLRCNRAKRGLALRRFSHVFNHSLGFGHDILDNILYRLYLIYQAANLACH